jgi:hypothetical protein
MSVSALELKLDRFQRNARPRFFIMFMMRHVWQVSQQEILPVISLPTGRIARRRSPKFRKNPFGFISLRQTIRAGEGQNNSEIIHA